MWNNLNKIDPKISEKYYDFPTIFEFVTKSEKHLQKLLFQSFT